MLKKEDSRFLKISKKINRKISSKKFEEAIRDYDGLVKEYTLLRKKKTENKLTFFSIRSQLLILLKIKETENLLKSDNDLYVIRKNINQLKSLSSEYSINKKLIGYAKEKIRYILSCYEYKIYKKDLKDSLDDVYYCICEERYEDALKRFSSVMGKFKEIERYEKNDEMYSSLMNLKTYIKTSLLADKAYSKIAKNR